MELHYTVAAQTDAGIVKKINQDSLTVKVAGTAHGEAAIAVICDGMGGLEQGEVASTIVVRAFEQWFLRDFPALLHVGLEAARLEKIWNQIICGCSQRIADYSGKQQMNMGTTLTALLLAGGSYYIAHVGDCRVYRMNEGISQLTTDQTYVAREVALGHMTQEQAKNDSRRNVLLQCIGSIGSIGKERAVEPEFLSGRVASGDSFLLCSDGFWHGLSDRELYEYCHTDLYALGWHVESRQENSHMMNIRLRQMIALNKQRMERDNISVILVKAMDE